MLDDAAVAAALESALLHLAPKLDLDLASGGRYPGLYQLMAHRSPEIRSLVSRYRASSNIRTSATCQRQWDLRLQSRCIVYHSDHSQGVARALPGWAASQTPSVLHQVTELCKLGPGLAAGVATDMEALCTPSWSGGCR